MKKIVAIVGLLGMLCGPGLAVIEWDLPAPQDDARARWGVYARTELEPLRAAYLEIIQSRLQPLRLEDAFRIFGPKLDVPTNGMLFGLVDGNNASGLPLGPNSSKPVLPLFAPPEMLVSGFLVNRVNNHFHADLHAMGDLGYVGLFYDLDGAHVMNAALYFRDDDKFVPLKSTNDFGRRLAWEKARFETVNKWLDEHMPYTDLGVVKFSTGSTNRVDLGVGGGLLLTVRDIHQPTVPFWFELNCIKETTNRVESMDCWQHRSIDRPGQSVAFRLDGKIYRLTPEFVNPTNEPQQ